MHDFKPSNLCLVCCWVLVHSGPQTAQTMYMSGDGEITCTLFWIWYDITRGPQTRSWWICSTWHTRLHTWMNMQLESYNWHQCKFLLFNHDHLFCVCHIIWTFLKPLALWISWWVGCKRRFEQERMHFCIISTYVLVWFIDDLLMEKP